MCIKEQFGRNAKVNNKVKIKIEINQSSIVVNSFARAVKTKHNYFYGWKTVGHVPRKIPMYVYSFIKKEGERISGNVKSLYHKPSSIPSGGLEVTLTFLCPEKRVPNETKDFINDFYTYDFTAVRNS